MEKHIYYLNLESIVAKIAIASAILMTVAFGLYTISVLFSVHSHWLSYPLPIFATITILFGGIWFYLQKKIAETESEFISDALTRLERQARAVE